MLGHVPLSAQPISSLPASGPATYTIVPSGGILFSGAAALVRNRIFVPSGSVTFSGTAALVRTKTLVPSGQVIFSGTAPIIFTPVVGVVTTVINRIRTGVSRLMGLS